jgi:hypothetical protein
LKIELPARGRAIASDSVRAARTALMSDASTLELSRAGVMGEEGDVDALVPREGEVGEVTGEIGLSKKVEGDTPVEGDIPVEGV